MQIYKNVLKKREDTIQKQAREAQVSNTSSNYIDAVLNADSLADAIWTRSSNDNDGKSKQRLDGTTKTR